MFRRFTMGAVFIAVGAGGLNAQPREGILRNLQLQSSDYAIVVAMPKSPAGTTIDLRNQPDPTVVYIADGRLVLGIDREVERTINDISALLYPSCTFDAAGQDSNSPKPIAIYVVRNNGAPVTRRQDAALESLSPLMPPATPGQLGDAQQTKVRTMSLTRLEPREPGFDVVFGVTKFPGSGRLVFKYHGEEDEIITTLVPLLVPSCITHVDHSDGTADVIAVYIVPKRDAVGPPMQ
jgi:hypothetical protein